ncbi:hypothetical protein MHYP_G00298500 [Metynnis hypsauchen]
MDMDSHVESVISALPARSLKWSEAAVNGWRCGGALLPPSGSERKRRERGDTWWTAEMEIKVHNVDTQEQCGSRIFYRCGEHGGACKQQIQADFTSASSDDFELAESGLSFGCLVASTT